MAGPRDAGRANLPLLLGLIVCPWFIHWLFYWLPPHAGPPVWLMIIGWAVGACGFVLLLVKRS